MKFYNPLDIAVKNDNNILGVFSILSIYFIVFVIMGLIVNFFGVIGLLLLPVVVIGRVLYAIFTGK